jgi:hypothetical protein
MSSKKEEAKQTRGVRLDNQRKKADYMNKVEHENKFKNQMRKQQARFANMKIEED